VIVKIQHSVDIDDVPKKVDDLVSEALAKIVHAASDVPANIGDINLQATEVSEVLELLSTTRKRLLMADSLLEDSTHILREWYSAKMSMNVVEAPDAEAPNE